MSNRKISHIIADLTGSSASEAFDIYDATALHQGELPDIETTRSGNIHLDFVGRTIRTGSLLSAQGMCIRTISGIPYIYTCYFNYNESAPRSVIEAIKMDGTVYKTSSEMNLGHSNDICYDTVRNRFVVAYGTTTIGILNGDTLALTSTQTISHATGAIAYDAVRDRYYTFTGNNTIRVYDSSFQLLESHVIYTGFPESQGLSYYDDKLYLLANQPNAVCKINVKDNFKVEEISEFDYFCSGYYPIGEIQSMDFYNGDGSFIINGKPRQYNPDTNSYEVGSGTTAFGKGNIDKNIHARYLYSQLALHNYIGIVQANNSVTKVFRPTGSSTYPFYTIAEAVLCLDCPRFTPMAIQLIGNFQNEDIVVSNKNIAIGGVSNSQTVDVKGGVIYNCYGTLRNINIVGNVTNSMHVVRSRLALTYVSANSATNQVVYGEAGTIFLVDPETCHVYKNKLYHMATSVMIPSNDLFSVAPTRWVKIGETTGSGSDFDSTITLTRSIDNYSEIMVTVQRPDGRTVASSVLNIDQFRSSAMYLYGNSTINASTNATISGVCIFKTVTSVELAFGVSTATDTYKYRVWVK